MKIKKVTKSDKDGWYVIVFDGDGRQWYLSDDEINNIDHLVEKDSLPKVEFYIFCNDNSCYGFVNKEKMILSKYLWCGPEDNKEIYYYREKKNI